MNKLSKLNSFQALGEVYHTEKPVGDKSNTRIETLKKWLIEYVNANKEFLDIEKIIKHIDWIKNLGTAKKYKMQLEEKIGKIDKEKYTFMNCLKQEMFEMINENQLTVDQTTLKKIVQSNSKRELKYLLIQIKKAYNLNFDDIDKTHKSIYAILTPMGNQMR